MEDPGTSQSLIYGSSDLQGPQAYQTYDQSTILTADGEPPR